MKWFLLILLIVQVCFGTNLPIYKPVSSYACTTLGDSEKSIGCTSSRGGDSGPLWPIETEDDISEFINNHGSPKKILVINSTLFTKDRVKRLIDTKDVAGILVTPGPAPSSGFSPVSQFPNKQYGLHSDSDYVWNPVGDDFAFEYFSVPMAALSTRKQSDDSLTSDDILTKARINKIEGGYPQWAVTLDTWMHSSGPAEVCINRGQCQPLGGKSVWSSLGGSVSSNKKLVFVSTSLDSNAFFHDLAIGANAHISSVITLLLTVHTLARSNNINNLDKQIVFGLFAGESWGYLGSKRFVDDLVNFNCKSLSEDGNSCQDPYRPSLEFQKIKLNNIELAIDVDQIGNLGNTLFVHKEKNTNSLEISKFFTIMQDNSNITIQYASSNTPGIPPSSLMPFIKYKNNISAIVLAEFNEQYNNKYYHSRFDNNENINVNNICNLATLLSQSIYSYASGNNSKLNSNITVDCQLASELVYCLTVNMSCDFASSYLQGLSFDSQPTQYTSVWSQNLLLSITAKFIHDVMAGLTATSIGDSCDSLADCKGSNDLCLNGKCISSTTYYHDALSLAFDLSSNGWSINKNNAQESTWTESNWDSISIKVFQMDSPVADVVVFVFGIINILASVVVIYILRQYLEKRFKTS